MCSPLCTASSLFSQKIHDFARHRHYFCSLPFGGAGDISRSLHKPKAKLQMSTLSPYAFAFQNSIFPSVHSWADTEMSLSLLVFAAFSSFFQYISLLSCLSCYVVRLLQAISAWTPRGYFPGCCSAQTFSPNMHLLENVCPAC